MAHRETPNQPNIQDMPIEEKWDRLHDFYTMDHAISYQTHKRMGTVQEWVDDLTHPNHPTSKMGVIPIEITWEETGCVWTFKVQ